MGQITDVFYKKKALNDGYKGLNVKERPTQEDVIRYSKARSERLTKFQFTSARNRIYWPEVLQRQGFFDHRTRIQGLFALRESNLYSGISSETQKVIEDIQTTFRECDMIRYASAAVNQDSMNVSYKRLVSSIDYLERHKN